MNTSNGGVAVLVRATDNPINDVLVGGQRIVQGILGEDADDLDAIRRIVDEHIPTLPDPWLTVCLDGAPSLAYVRTLATLPLRRWGIRVATTIVDRDASSSALAAAATIVAEIEGFTDSQLTEFLQRHGRRRADVRADLFGVLRQPLLAELYVGVSTLKWSPENEYALFDALFHRLTSPDRDVLLRLARAVLEGRPYPWTPAVLRKIGATDAQLNRLAASAWIQRRGQRASMWHERLLNWAIAEVLVHDHVDDLRLLASRIAGMARDAGHAGGRLGYVPMDAVWLCVHRERLSSASLVDLLEGIEEEGVFDLDALYGVLLSTIGAEIGEALLMRARRADGTYRSGTKEALQTLDRHLRSLRFQRTSDHDNVVRSIDATPRGRRLARFLWTKIRTWPLSMWRTWWIELLVPHLDATTMHERSAREVANQNDRATNAILCLARFDTDAAFEAAIANLTSDNRERSDIPALLMHLDEFRAIKAVIEHHVNELIASVRWGIGRALRTADATAVRSAILVGVAATDADIRASACELAGWLDDHVVEEWRLAQLATTDEANRVRERATAALGRRRLLLEMVALRSRIASARGFDAWRLAEALIAIGDAEILDSSRDDLSIWPVLDRHTLALRIAVREWLTERAKTIADSSRGADRDHMDN